MGTIWNFWMQKSGGGTAVKESKESADCSNCLLRKYTKVNKMALNTLYSKHPASINIVPSPNILTREKRWVVLDCDCHQKQAASFLYLHFVFSFFFQGGGAFPKLLSSSRSRFSVYDERGGGRVTCLLGRRTLHTSVVVGHTRLECRLVF